jgi:aminoglycoside phosphotransferase (APT) family kinase protein
MSLDVACLPAYLASRGLPVPADAKIEELGGGVSSAAFAVAASGRSVVVKRALATLKVAERWEASPERTLVEGRALRLAGELAPDWTPTVVDLDEDSFTLTMERAPVDWVPWKQQLLAGNRRSEVGRRLGGYLAVWHAATVEAAPLGLAERETFRRLRVDPFYVAAAERNPEVAAEVEATLERMLATQTALVHGNFSPKNVLVGDRSSSRPADLGVWVLDFEVAHVGDPSFDQPAGSVDLASVADAFLEGYVGVGGASVDGRHLHRQVACLLLARVDGKSPVEYLDDAGRRRTRALAHAVLREPARSLGSFWRRLDDTARGR